MKEIQKKLINSVFIVESFNQGWIIEKLMQDLKKELELRNIEVNIGSEEKYNGEEVAFHSRAFYFKKINKAKINSVFMTHIDSHQKENEMRAISKEADSIVCMSENHADLISTMGFKGNIIGINLPNRGGNVKRNRIGIFSDHYNDGRKNEKWLAEYLSKLSDEKRDNLIVCFLGHNWENFINTINQFNISYEIYRYSRTMPGEYHMQKEIISNLDYLLYMGFDGGSMSIYDALLGNTKLIISDQCYHKGINSAILFRNKSELFDIFDNLINETQEKEIILNQRSIQHYTSKLLNHWASIHNSEISNYSNNNNKNLSSEQEDSVKEFRSRYKTSFLETIKSIYRKIKRRL